eukprot:gnl/TRDRNA2_/TRDRNA2_174197_c0_seq1.p1 gnl/TRDRNA2_/TRDRNA2_174197_c0~~gnl/TRDRNA2_/TRDRNA2_174197_c0_seq1.p1  ORF type:complete len:186 (-),score=0.74 gnl/TRDRNA2_/TRDRNA2_174197_c0_seq1:219-776(-)
MNSHGFNSLETYYSKFRELQRLYRKTIKYNDSMINNNTPRVSHKKIHERILTAEEAALLNQKYATKETHSNFETQKASKVYNKRSAAVPYTKYDYNRMKNEALETPALSSQDFQAVSIPDPNIDIMTSDLKKQIINRMKHSRSRIYHTDKYVDSVNDRNANFNRKLERAFGKFTTEIDRFGERQR